MSGCILICGGAGYIGSHMVRALADSGHEVVVLDDLSTGHRQAVGNRRLFQGSLLSVADLDRVFSEHPVTSVMHFAAKALVAESVAEPFFYYENNVVGTLRLLQAMEKYRVKQMIFSSSCATYGNPLFDRMEETHPQNPVNPYGESKLMCERLLRDAASAYGISSVSLRYFNAAGASLDGFLGESHNPETHLIPNAIRAALDDGGRLRIMGDDYATRDGTCVRDYVHVVDLVDAHALALSWVQRNPGAHAFNLGTECGTSVLEVVKAVEAVSGKPLPCQVVARRAGDPPSLVADSRRAREVLGWQPIRSSIREVVKTAWAWHQSPRY